MRKSNNNTKQLTEHFFRHHYAKMVAILVRYFGLKEVELAEDIVQDSLIEAMEKWSVQSIPDNPEGWLMDVAKKKTINFLRRNQLYENKIIPSLKLSSFERTDFDFEIEEDSTLRMMFACCHPLLPNESQVALALKSLCGLSVSEIANALLSNESTVNKRLYRAKQKFRDGSITFEIPEKGQLEERLDSMLSTLYLLFNEGYFSIHHEETIRMDLCFEAIRLTKQVNKAFPDSTKSRALLALMLLSVARFEARLDKDGMLIILSEQNRALWDKELIAEGIEHLNNSIRGKEITKYQLEAGIAAEHCVALDFKSTNWKSIHQQYQILEQLDDNHLIKFNRCIAMFYSGETKKAIEGLLLLEPKLKTNANYYTTIGVFYTEIGEKEKGVPYFQTALSLSTSTIEIAHIKRKMGA